MFVAIYHKTTKKIVQYRHDMADPATHTAQEYFNMFLNDNEFGDENYTFAVLPITKSLNIITVGNHVYNEATGQIEADPNFVPRPELMRTPNMDPAT